MREPVAVRDAISSLPSAWVDGIEVAPVRVDPTLRPVALKGWLPYAAEEARRESPTSIGHGMGVSGSPVDALFSLRVALANGVIQACSDLRRVEARPGPGLEPDCDPVP